MASQKRPEGDAADAEADPNHELDDEDRAQLQTLFDEEDPDARNYLKDKEKYARNLKLLLDSFTPEQRQRHEMYRRSKFKLNNIKKVLADGFVFEHRTVLPSVIYRYLSCADHEWCNSWHYPQQNHLDRHGCHC
eukprot:m.68951 g.68951  ORF g.68951 m.68951 type:complete len:134 (+) comp14101_c0_seq2:1433-1834(+)